MTAAGNVPSYKISTYKNAAYGLRNSDFAVCTASPSQIKGISGIGDSLRATILRICQKGEFPELDTFMQDIPEGVIEMSQINGLGPKKINVLWREYGIDNLDKLEAVIENGALLQIKGYGKATVEKISKNLQWLKANKGKKLYAHVADLSVQVLEYFIQLFPGHAFIPIGDIVRKSDVIASIDILTDLSLTDAREEISLLDKIIESKPEYILLDFEDTTVRLMHHEADTIEKEAHRINYTLGDTLIDDRRPVFQVENYYLDRVPQYQNLIEVEDIKGLIHSHSVYSDGKNTIEEMAKACIEMGLEYMVISDHSQSAFYANGLSPEDIHRQSEEIDKLNEALTPFRIFKSIESDILTDGSLDYEDKILDQLDIVIISIHSGLSMDSATATKRLIRAIEHPSTNILGHMTGRLLLRREGYPVEIEEVAEACLKNNVAIELNANPRRLDVDAYYMPFLLSMGIKTSINPDAHSTEGIGDIKWGVVSAQKGGVQASDNISSMSRVEFQKFYNIA